MGGVRLVWDGKDAQAPRFRLPLQVVETVNAVRADEGTLSFDAGPDDGWRNKLIWGDNLHVLHSLADELAGQVDLVYIDPPFDSRQDYKVRIAVGDGDDYGDQELSKLTSLIEEKAYRDTWGKGIESYLQMLYERVVSLHKLLSDAGTLYLHIGRSISGYVRPMLDEVFGSENFVNEITWKRSHAHGDSGQGSQHYGRVTEAIFVYAKNAQGRLWKAQYSDYTDERLSRDYKFREPDGRIYRLAPVDGPGGAAKGNPYYTFLGVAGYWRFAQSKMQKMYDDGLIVLSATGKSLSQKKYLDQAKGTPITDLWDDVNRISPTSKERLGYDTQKPEALLERIIKSSSDEGSIVLDCFVGSGTTAAVAEKLKRRWVAVDMGRFAVHTTRKRLLDIPNCRPFTVGNLGSYERQAWQRATTGEQVAAYLDFLVQLYGASTLDGFQHLHGVKGPVAVHVGAIDAAVGLGEIKEALDEAVAAGYPALDVLGWDFDLGLHELVEDEASGRGLRLRLRRIPSDVMDERARRSGEIVFHELAYLQVVTRTTRKQLTVEIADFVLPNPDLIPASVQKKITGWADYIDYWAVDFDFSDDTFHNQWQSFRTRTDRTLARSITHDYERAGMYTVLVKAVDIFGNDTTVSQQVTVGNDA